MYLLKTSKNPSPPVSPPCKLGHKEKLQAPVGHNETLAPHPISACTHFPELYVIP